jgi:hypothetical protein
LPGIGPDVERWVGCGYRAGGYEYTETAADPAVADKHTKASAADLSANRYAASAHRNLTPGTDGDLGPGGSTHGNFGSGGTHRHVTTDANSYGNRGPADVPARGDIGHGTADDFVNGHGHRVRDAVAHSLSHADAYTANGHPNSRDHPFDKDLSPIAGLAGGRDRDTAPGAGG